MKQACGHHAHMFICNSQSNLTRRHCGSMSYSALRKAEWPAQSFTVKKWMEPKSEHMAACLQGAEDAWSELVLEGYVSRMTAGGRPGGFVGVSALGMVRGWAAVFSEEQRSMSFNQQTLILRAERDVQVLASHWKVGPDEERCGNGPGEAGWVLGVKVRMIESSNVASTHGFCWVWLSSPLLAFGKASAGREQSLLPLVPEGHSQYQSWWRNRLDLSGYLLNSLLYHCGPWPKITCTMKLLAHACLQSSVNSKTPCSFL